MISTPLEKISRTPMTVQLYL